MDQPPLQFSPRQIANSLRVSESSIKRWCDHGTISTVRTVGGHRRITLPALQEFLRSSNHSLSNPHALGIEEKDLGLVTGQASQTSQPTPSYQTIRALDQSEFLSALAAGQEDVCRRLLQIKLDDGWSRTEAAEDLIVDAMRGIGDQWDCGQLHVFQERRSCLICTRLIHWLFEGLVCEAAADSRSSQNKKTPPVAIGAAPETDPYEIPTALVQLALRESGWNAINLGHNLPLESMIRAAKEYRPKLVWLSVTWLSDPQQFIDQQNKLADSLGPDVSLIVGGQGLNDGLRPHLRYTAHCDSLRHLIRLAARLRG